MSAADEIKALREEIAKQAEDIKALTAAMLQLAVNTPQPYYYPVSYYPQPQSPPYWWQTPQYPLITYSTSTSNISGSL